MRKMYTFTLDTLQIFFPWDDDLYTYLKNKGFASKNGFKALPLIYTDNCERTTGKQELPRNYLIEPEKFNKTAQELGWKPFGINGKKYSIPAEKPRLNVFLTDDNTLKFEIVPTVDGKEQYHLEYSVMSAFGKGYKNWSMVYFRFDEFEAFVEKLRQEGVKAPSIRKMIEYEDKQAQREGLYYVRINILEYCFNIGEFKYAEEYIRNAGYSDQIPSLVYNSRDPKHRELMEPFMMLSIVSTGEQGFWDRPPQVVSKIVQPKYTTTGGRNRRVKGVLDPSKRGNYFVVDASDLLSGWECILAAHSCQRKLI
ncbi:MAG: hypothetical protein ABC585_05490 [Candidatus Methanosuratincola petrocarbonis]